MNSASEQRRLSLRWLVPGSNPQNAPATENLINLAAVIENLVFDFPPSESYKLVLETETV